MNDTAVAFARDPGWVAAVAAMLGVALPLLLFWINSHRQKRAQIRAFAQQVAFPFDVFLGIDLPALRSRFADSEMEVPRQPRFPLAQQAAFEKQLDSGSFILVGPSGSGKTREAVEAIRRLVRAAPSDAAIWVPLAGHNLDYPRTTLPPSAVRRKIILFLDNVDELAGANRADIDPEERSFTKRFEELLSWLDDTFRGREARIVLTTKSDPEDSPQLAGLVELLRHQGIERIDLQEVHPDSKADFVAALADSLGVILPLGGVEAVVDRWDGKVASIDVGLREYSARLFPLTEINKSHFTFPAHWIDTVFSRLRTGREPAAFAFQALAALWEARIPPLLELVTVLGVSLAAREHVTLKRKDIKRAINISRDWMSINDGFVVAKEAYLSQLGRELDWRSSVLEVVLWSLNQRVLRWEVAASLPVFSKRIVEAGGGQEVVQVLDKAVEVLPDLEDLWLALSGTLMSLGRPADALERISHGISQGLVGVRMQLELARCQAACGRGEEALRSSEEAVKMLPTFLGGWLVYGVTLSRGGRYSEAVEALENALKLRPRSSVVAYSLAIALDRRGAPDDKRRALRLFLAAVHFDPANPIAWLSLGVALENRDKPQWGRRAFRRAVLLSPGHLKVRRRLALNLARFGSVEEKVEASELFSSMIDRENGSAEEWASVAALSARFSYLEQFRELAINFAETALSLDPQHRGAERTLAVCFGARPDRGSRLRSVEIMTRRSTEPTASADDWYHLSVARGVAGLTGMAIAAASRALVLDPSHKGAKESLATNLSRNNKRSDILRSVALMEEVVNAEPDGGGADDWYHLSVARGLAGYHELAVEAAKQALAIDRNHPGARRSLSINQREVRELDQRLDETAAVDAELGMTADDWCDLSIARSHRGAFELAVSAAQEALAIAPEKPRALLSLFLNLQNCGEREAASRAGDRFELVVARMEDPTPDTWFYLATARGYLGRSIDAIEAALKGLREDPSSWFGWQLVSIMLGRLGRTAVDTTRRAILAVAIPNSRNVVSALRDEPTEASHWRLVSWLALDSPDIDLLALAEDALRSEEKGVTSAMLAAVEEFTNLAPEQGAPLCRLILEHAPENAKAWNLLGVIERHLGRAEDAVRAHLRAIEINNDPRNWYALGRTYEDFGMVGEARSAFRSAIRHSARRYRKAEEALRRLQSA